MKKQEERLHENICQYIRMQYPDVIFTSDSSGVRLTIGQAVKMKKLRSEKGIPDLIILEPRVNYHGLILELKRENETVFLKDGSLSKDAHIQEQDKILTRLAKKGYLAIFVVGFDKAKHMINYYMNLQ